MMTTSNEHNNAPAVPQTVYLVENRTCLLAYASREDADKAVASMPASVGGGFLVSPVQVFGAPTPAVPQGWKLVPVEPTRAMWAAVNKLDDEMAAGSYDGKGCSIEQAWNCMLDFAPDAPALAATQAPAPAQEGPDKHEREMLEVIDERDRIHEWADQLADAIAKHTGYEIGEHTSANNPWRMALNALVCHEAKQEAGLTDEEIDRVVLEAVGFEGYGCQAMNKADMRGVSRAIIAALRAKGAS